MIPYRRYEGCSVTSQILVMIAHIEAEREEDIIPYEHLHLWFLAGVDCHYVPIDYGHGAACCRRYEIAVHLATTQ